VGTLLVSGSDVVAEQPREGVFIHITHGEGNPHRVLMALAMAEIMDLSTRLI